MNTADATKVEHCFNRLKQFPDLAARYAKRATYYQHKLIIVATLGHLDPMGIRGR